MTESFGVLKSLATRYRLIAEIIRRLGFLRELAAHQKLIRPYRSLLRRLASSRIIETPLLIGYFETGFGLGEYARGLASALEVVGTSFAIYPYNSYTGRSPIKTPWVRLYDVDQVHSINIFCMAADQTLNARRIIGNRYTEKSYNILSTFWELPLAPKSWQADLEFFDELWVPNQFVADAFRPIFPKHISIIPPCINLDGKLQSRHAKFGIEATKFYFLFYFDFSSHPERKNPQAVITAFEAAFGNGRDDIGLILKSAGARHLYPKTALELETAARRDRRIKILHGDWQRADVLALLASVDCFVSLHRSEGFGLGLAESMFLGKSVIATDFSGNTEFLTSETGYPVPYQMRPVAEGEYPHYKGNSWAEPDVRMAAEIMRSVASRTDEARSKALRGQAYIRQHYSSEVVGRLAAERLRELTAGVQRGSRG